jgi:predicted N-acetyltransferase YhbS
MKPLVVKIRAGRVEDAQAIRAVEKSAGERFRTVGLNDIADAEVTLAKTLSHRARNGRLFVAEEDDRVCGFAMYSEVDGFCYLEEVSVSSSHGGRGIGRDLIAAIEDAGRRSGLAWITLSTFRDVPWNGPYYARLGFVEWPHAELPPGHLVRYANQKRDGLDMSRRFFMRKRL